MMTRHSTVSKPIKTNKVLLVNPNQMRPPVAPLGIDYLHGALEDQGFEVELLDLAFSEDMEADIGRVSEGNYIFTGVTLRNVDDSYLASQDFCLAKSREIIQRIRELSGSPVVLGGVGFSIFPLEVMEYCGADFGVYGDGESALPRLAGALRDGKDFTSIPGLVYMAGDKYRMNNPDFTDLRKGIYRRRLVDNRRYFREGAMVGFETKRGCDRPCIYCADPVARGRRVRMRDPEDVARELQDLLDMGITHFHTGDSEFNLSESHAMDVCRAIIGRGLGEKIRWYAYCLPVPFSEELAGLMRRAGCSGIDFTVDSGNDEQLRRLGHRHTSEDVRNLSLVCRRNNFSVMFDLLIGGPGENRASTRETLELMKNSGDIMVGISLGVRLYPRTKLGSLVIKQGLDKGNPHLRGTVNGNKGLLRPIFYLSADAGPDIGRYISDIIDGDQRFFFAARDQVPQNYNYNENSRLMDAIKQGYRGAFWDILTRIVQ